ncbi:MAG: metal-dependent hydrolase [Gammaproteobacteria bacterium]|nr:metal-dependent hydrolase [Gammaproteobacteria bacterium]MDH5592380.1 metal-dependent hydrolase [Gammaproteobacteria bacterium]
MDTLTQALLGGAVGYVVAGKQTPRKALLWGAAIAVLPDLDVFIPYEDDLTAITMHRSWTHSWLIQTLVAPLLAYGMHRFDTRLQLHTWCWLIWLVLITHSGLDALTVYGTQLFWPFMPPPVSGGSIFIIDPIYTASLLAGFIGVVVLPDSNSSRRWLLSGFVFSCCYLLWGLTAQNWVEQQARTALAKHNIAYNNILVGATPFNSLLWRVLVIDDEHYYQGFRSVFDPSDDFNFSQYDRHSDLKTPVENLASFERLDWFTHGFYAMQQHDSRIIATDLRMGIEPIYFFRFQLAEVNNDNSVTPFPSQRIRSQSWSLKNLGWLWQRVWDPDAQLVIQFKQD